LELQAARDKDGVFLPKDVYDQQMKAKESADTEIRELTLNLKGVEEQLEKFKVRFFFKKKKEHTGLESLIGNFDMDIPQCGNLAIFLSLWIYVKSILADFSQSKNAVLTILEVLNSDFRKISHLKMSKAPKNSNCKSCTNSQKDSF